eukprot:COSAG02_NODE_4056_length_5846_cov_4.137115_2_plen_319_part_00
MSAAAEEGVPPADAAAGAAAAAADAAEPEPQPQDDTQPPQALVAAAALGTAAVGGTDGLASPAPAPAPEDADDDALTADDYSEYTRDGISLDGLVHAIRLFEGKLAEGATTSELCQLHIKPMTVAPGWVDEPQLIEFDDQGNDVSANGWYKHVYSRQRSSSGGGGGGATSRQGEAPPGTRSMCRLLAADAATTRFVGRPTHFLSHAWLYRILDVAGALEAFVSSLPRGSRERTFFWFDCFSLDQVSGQVRASPVIWLPLCRRGRAALLIHWRCLRCAARPERPGERVVEHDLHAGHRQHGPHCDGEKPVPVMSFSDLL